MESKYYNPHFYFFLFLFFWVFLLVFYIFLPFLQVLVLAMVLATTLTPLYEKVLEAIGDRRSLAALISTLLILALIVVPTVFLGIRIVNEATQLSSVVLDGGIQTFLPSVLESISGLFPQAATFLSKISFDADQQLKEALGWILQNIAPLVSGATGLLIDFLILLIALYYLLKDGEKLKDFIILLSPMPVEYDKQILNKLRTTVNAVIGGMLVIAIIQGILAAVGFTIFGVPNAILWGSVAAMTSLIPTIGTSIIVFPAIIYLYLMGNVFSAAGLLFWGIVVVGLVDNYLGPKLVERQVGIHPFVILLSILGGVSFFGPIGFLFGPLTISLCLAMLEVYKMMGDER